MKQLAIVTVTLLAMVAGPTLAQDTEKKVKMSEMPPAVQKAISDYTAGKGATIRGLAMEVEKGKRLYEAELRINGRTRDVTFDEAGAIFSLEEETSLDQIPAGARAAIEKAATGSKVTLVETVTSEGVTYYEAHIDKGGRRSEVKVNAAGEAVK